jgi:hypothetical protein
MTKPDDDALRARVERLEREVPPARDLWPDIVQRIEAQGARRKGARVRLSYTMGASALALAAAVALFVAARGRARTGSPSPLLASASAPPATSVAETPREPSSSPLPGEPEYEGAEHALDSELDARRSALPPSEAAVLEDNLRIVDQAIASTRSAVLERPDDLELRAELDRDWQDKIDLLRQAIELPSEM